MRTPVVIGAVVAALAVGGVLVAVTNSSGSSSSSTGATTTETTVDDQAEVPVTPTSAFPRKQVASVTIAAGTPVREVKITAEGFSPEEFVAVIGYPVRWTNTTGSTRSIHLLNVDPAIMATWSGPIPPGGSWALVPDRAVSAVYISDEAPDLVGRFRSEPARKPTETVLPTPIATTAAGPSPSTTTS
jgi:hypothetical protein